MAAVNSEEIELAYEAACKVAREENDGRLDCVTEMALKQMAVCLLESLVSEATNYQKSAENRIKRGEEALARLGYDDVANLFTDDAA